MTLICVPLIFDLCWGKRNTSAGSDVAVQPVSTIYICVCSYFHSFSSSPFLFCPSFVHPSFSLLTPLILPPSFCHLLPRPFSFVPCLASSPDPYPYFSPLSFFTLLSFFSILPHLFSSPPLSLHALFSLCPFHPSFLSSLINTSLFFPFVSTPSLTTSFRPYLSLLCTLPSLSLFFLSSHYSLSPFFSPFTFCPPLPLHFFPVLLLFSSSPFPPFPVHLPSLFLQWHRCVSTTRPASAAASCRRKTRRLAPPAAWVRLPAALRSSCRPAPSSAPPPARPPLPLPRPRPPPCPPPRLLCPGPAAWTFPAPCRCPTWALSRRCSGLAVSAVEPHRQSAT